jgi:hypothetical protein
MGITHFRETAAISKKWVAQLCQLQRVLLEYRTAIHPMRLTGVNLWNPKSQA